MIMSQHFLKSEFRTTLGYFKIDKCLNKDKVTKEVIGMITRGENIIEIDKISVNLKHHLDIHMLK